MGIMYFSQHGRQKPRLAYFFEPGPDRTAGGCVAKYSGLGVEERFFDYSSESSRIKQKIVVDYFSSWANVLARNRIVGYADLFAGPGRYKNGEKSTPLLITERVIQDERLRKSVRLWFNEGDPDYAKQLKENVLSLPVSTPSGMSQRLPGRSLTRGSRQTSVFNSHTPLC